MINSRSKIDKKRLRYIARQCYNLLITSKNKYDALLKISETAAKEFGEYFSPNILLNSDQISVNFIEIMDQILFEIEENDSDEENIRNYIIEDLYNRIKIYLEIFEGEDVYKKSLSNRIITCDDTFIISQFNMARYVPDLMTEFYEQPNLQKPILKALLKFDVEELLNFYYQIVKDVFCLEIKCLALTGLKCLSTQFRNWHLLKLKDDALAEIADYAEKFNINRIESNALPEKLYCIYFAINFIEKNLNNLMYSESVDWIMKLFKNLLKVNIGNAIFDNIYMSLSNIILLSDTDCFISAFQRNSNLVTFLRLIDILPPSYFNRITIKLDNFGREFVELINEQIAKNMIKTDKFSSNIFNYLLWQFPDLF